ncbi:MAG: hypothetical protein ACLTU3_07405 [Acutalibacteraceae bacterium]
MAAAMPPEKMSSALGFKRPGAIFHPAHGRAAGKFEGRTKQCVSNFPTISATGG